MCLPLRLIRLFTLCLLFSVLLGLHSVNCFASGYYTYSRNGKTVRISETAGSGAVSARCIDGTLCNWTSQSGVSQTVIGSNCSASMSPFSCTYTYTQSDSPGSSSWTLSITPTYYACPSGQSYDASASSSNYCGTSNSCISGLTPAGSGYPVATPGHSGDGRQITFCASSKCQATAWESISVSFCADNSSSCPPVAYLRSEMTYTGQSCTTPNLSDKQPFCSGGMQLLGGVCVCPAGARVQGGVCRQLIDCSTGYHRVNDSCISDACPAGEIIQDNKCVPDPLSTVKNPNPATGEPPIACAAGRHYDTSLASCVSNTAANGGTSGSPGTPGNPNTGNGGVGGGLPGESGSAESSDCAQAPVCAGDAVQCAMLTQVWRNHCESVPQSVISAHPVPAIESVDLSASAISSLNAPAALTFAAVCPADKSLSIMGHSYVLSWQPACDGASYLKPIIIAIAFLHGLYVVFSIRKGE